MTTPFLKLTKDARFNQRTLDIGGPLQMLPAGRHRIVPAKTWVILMAIACLGLWIVGNIADTIAITPLVY